MHKNSTSVENESSMNVFVPTFSLAEYKWTTRIRAFYVQFSILSLVGIDVSSPWKFILKSAAGHTRSLDS